MGGCLPCAQHLASPSSSEDDSPDIFARARNASRATLPDSTTEPPKAEPKAEEAMPALTSPTASLTSPTNPKTLEPLGKPSSLQVFYRT